MILGWGSVEKVRRRVEKVHDKVHKKEHEGHEIAAAACQLTPEKRPFLSSYVLMSVRRSKFEYILTLGWKYNEGLLDCAIKIDEDMLCSSNKECILNSESDSPDIFL